MQYFDLSHVIENGMRFYPGDPEPRLTPVAMPEPWRVTQLSMGTHTGTHIDAAAHFLPGGKTIDRYPVERFCVSGIVVPLVPLDEDQPVEVDTIAEHIALLPSRGVVLMQTGWDRYWKSERYLHHPYLSAEAAQLLVDRGASMVGIDTLSVDSTMQGTSHAHEILLGNDVLIVENLARLDQLLPGCVYQFSFLPLLLAGLDGSPVRAIAWL
jgi:arylformamidase